MLYLYKNDFINEVIYFNKNQECRNKNENVKLSKYGSEILPVEGKTHKINKPGYMPDRTAAVICCNFTFSQSKDSYEYHKPVN